MYIFHDLQKENSIKVMNAILQSRVAQILPIIGHSAIRDGFAA